MSSSPWRTLLDSRRPAAQIQEDKSRMNFRSTLEDRLGEVEQGHADTLDYLGYQDLIDINDGIPPAAPQNLVVTPVPFRELDATWDTPPDVGQVVGSVMEITPFGGSAHEVQGTALFAFETGLAGGVSHSIRVKLVDRWGLESAWSAAVSATPMLTAAEQIDIDALAILGRINGLLPNANLATIQDATKLGTGIVTAAAMAAGDAAFMNAWIQNAAISSAKIANLVADKITTGTLSAATITLSLSGKLVAGATTFSATGIDLGVTANIADIPSADQTIANAGTAFSSLHFFDQRATAGIRGAVLRGDGDGSNRGHIQLAATRYLNGNTYDGNQSAAVDVKGRSTTFLAEDPAVAIWPYLDVQKGGATFVGAGGINSNGSITATGSLQTGADITAGDWIWSQGSIFYDGILTPNMVCAQTAITGGSTVTWTHNFFAYPGICAAWQSLGSGQLKPLPAGGTDFGVYVDWMTTTQLRIRNNEGATWACGANLYK